MSVSEYIKTRLFEDADNKEKQINNYEKILISSSVKSFWILQNIQYIMQDTLNKKKSKSIKKSLENADQFLVEEGFKTKKEFDKLYNKD